MGAQDAGVEHRAVLRPSSVCNTQTYTRGWTGASLTQLPLCGECQERGEPGGWPGPNVAEPSVWVSACGSKTGEMLREKRMALPRAPTTTWNRRWFHSRLPCVSQGIFVNRHGEGVQSGQERKAAELVSTSGGVSQNNTGKEFLSPLLRRRHGHAPQRGAQPGAHMHDTGYTFHS